MKEAIEEILYHFDVFVGGSKWHLLGYLICLVICIFIEKENRKQILIPFILSVLVVFNPIMYQLIGTKFLSGVYWRFFWIFPTGVVVAVASVFLISHLKKKWQKAILLCGLLIAIAWCGNPLLSDGNYEKAENAYEIPQSVIDVCDVILEDADGERVKAIVPNEMLIPLRQYTSQIGLFYGRNVTGFISDANYYQMLAFEIMSSSEPDVYNLTLMARGSEIDYIVFNNNFHLLPEDMEQYGYEFFNSMDGYDIYKISE